MNTNQLIRFDQKDGFYNAYDCITTMQNRLKLFSIVKASLFYSWIKLIFSKKVQGSRERERGTVFQLTFITMFVNKPFTFA